MTIETDLADRMRALCAPHGAKAEIFLSIRAGRIADECRATFYPDGIIAASGASEAAPTFVAALDRLQAKMDAAAARIRAANVRRMAFAIIEAYADRSACDFSDVMRAGFSSADLTQFGAAAEAEANRLAGKEGMTIVGLDAKEAAQ